MADANPADVVAQNNAGRILEDQNRPDEVRRYYLNALRSQSGDVEARHGLDRLDKRQTPRQAPGAGQTGRWQDGNRQKLRVALNH